MSNKLTQPPFNWRAHPPVHSAAELFPLMSEAELKELAEDIEAHGLLEPIILFATGSQAILLDGRNRLDALSLTELLSLDDDGNLQIANTAGHKARVHYWLER